jgi:hypothetical protein
MNHIQPHPVRRVYIQHLHLVVENKVQSHHNNKKINKLVNNKNRY